MSNSEKLKKILGGYALSVRGESFFTIKASQGHVENVISILTSAGFTAFYDEEDGEVCAC